MSKELKIKNNFRPEQAIEIKTRRFKQFLILPFYFLFTTSLIAPLVLTNIAPVQAQKSSSSLV